MENFSYYNTSSINFIKILNRFLVVFVGIALVLVVVLSLNDTVKFKDGHIYSDTPQFKINSPDEVRVIKVAVKEGQEVRKGDTLFVLENKKTASDFNVLTTDVASMQQKIEIIRKLIANTQQRKQALNQLLQIQSTIYNTDRKKTEQDLRLLSNKINLAAQQNSIWSDKYKTDSLLYAKGAISKYELTDTKNRSLDDKKTQVDMKSISSIKNYDYENLTNNFNRTKNDLKRNIIEVDNTIEGYKRDIEELQAKIKDGTHTLTYVQDELHKLVVVSPFDGTVSNLYNAQQNIEIIPKGELLTIIAPKKEQFYAKVVLDEVDLAYVKKGQEINLKLDAFNYYRYGAIKGKITYVSPSDVNKTFYCLATIYKYNPNIVLKAGFSLKGEVIIERMRLYDYIFKKLFNKMDENVNS
jgi:multidrug resistance efflux pump